LDQPVRYGAGTDDDDNNGAMTKMVITNTAITEIKTSERDYYGVRIESYAS
jgi:hypothetical protein